MNEQKITIQLNDNKRVELQIDLPPVASSVPAAVSASPTTGQPPRWSVPPPPPAPATLPSPSAA